MRALPGPSVEVLIGTYDRVIGLPAVLDCFRAQTHRNWRVKVLDEHPDRLSRAIVGTALDVRIEHRAFPVWHRDWHYTVRQEAGFASEADWLCFAVNDGLYAPTFLSTLLASAQAERLDLVACDWVYAHAGYTPWSVELRTGHIDIGGFLIRSQTFRDLGGFPNRGHEADGQLVEAAVRSGARCGVVRQTLYMQG